MICPVSFTRLGRGRGGRRKGRALNACAGGRPRLRPAGLPSPPLHAGRRKRSIHLLHKPDIFRRYRQGAEIPCRPGTASRKSIPTARKSAGHQPITTGIATKAGLMRRTCRTPSSCPVQRRTGTWYRRAADRRRCERRGRPRPPPPCSSQPRSRKPVLPRADRG